jgi:hypothetical protein
VEDLDVSLARDYHTAARVECHRVDVVCQIRIRVERDPKTGRNAHSKIVNRHEIGRPRKKHETANAERPERRQNMPNLKARTIHKLTAISLTIGTSF